jgi:hypothetical protein
VLFELRGGHTPQYRLLDFVTWDRRSNRAVLESGRGGLALIDLKRRRVRTLNTPRLAFPTPCFTATGRLLIRADARSGADAAVLFVSDRRLSIFSRVAPSGPLRPFYVTTQCDGIAPGGVPQIWLVGGGVIYSSPVERLDGTPLVAAAGLDD